MVQFDSGFMMMNDCIAAKTVSISGTLEFSTVPTRVLPEDIL